MLTILSLAAVFAIALLGWVLYRKFTSDVFVSFNEKHRASSRIVGHGEFVDGNRHFEVALALSDKTFFYENADMEASLDLEWIREIEYDNELATGAAVEVGRVLRLRSDSQTFEFVLPPDAVANWQAILPPRTQATSGDDTKRKVAIAT